MNTHTNTTSKLHTYPDTCPFDSISDIKDKHVTIMGLGLNGGGEAAVRFFLEKGAYVTVTDMKTQEQLQPTIDRLENGDLDITRLTYRLGEHRLSDFENADCVIKNPGVKYQGNKYLAAAKAIETDLSIFLRFTDCPIIAVTGSKGKSSTVSAIYYGLKTAGFDAYLGGNITVSPLTFIDKVNKDTPVVIEFSSWQLADLRGRGILKPHISIITKIVPDHQNWYGNMEDYVADKRLIYKNQIQSDYSIFDGEPDELGTEPDKKLHQGINSWGDLFAKESKATVLRYCKSKLENDSNDSKNAPTYGVWLETKADDSYEGKVYLPKMMKPETILNGLSVPGEHMKINALNAALVLYLMGVPADRTAEIMKSWPGIDHRLQYFHSWTNSNNTTFKFYNDSCATVPESVVEATQAFGKSVFLATGGTDKGLDLAPLTDLLTQKGTLNQLNENGIIPVRSIYLLEGTATDKLIPELEKAHVKFHGPFPSMYTLLQRAREILDTKVPTECDEIFVMSPGATSFGMFANEFDRGNKFMEGTKKLFK